MLVVFSLLLFSKTYHTITVDGDLSDWDEDELVYLDYENDGAWGLQNQLLKLYLTWDAGNLYIGVEAIVKDGNHIVIYFDTGSTNGLSDVSGIMEGGTTWYWSKNHKFSNFRASFQLHSYQTEWNTSMGHGLFRISGGYPENLNSSILIAKTGPSGYSPSSCEVRIPFSTLNLNVQNSRLKIIATLTGGTNQANSRYGSVHDSIPNQNENDTYTHDWFESFTLEKYIEVVIDSDADGAPDMDVSPIMRNLRYTVKGRSIELNWDFRAVKEAVKYFEVYDSTTTTYISTASKNSITLQAPDTTKYYFIKAVYDSITSGRSDIAVFYPPRIYSDFQAPQFTAYPLKPLKIRFNYAGTADSFELFYRFNSGSFYSTGPVNTGPDYADFIIPDVYGVVEYYIKISSVVFPSSGLYKTLVVSKYEKYVVDGSLFLPPDERTGIIGVPQGVFGIEKIDSDAITAYNFYTLKDGIKKGYVFENPVKLRIAYDDDDNDGIIDGTGISEKNIEVYWLGSNGWSKAGGVVNEAQNYIETTVSHLTVYGIKERQSYPQNFFLKKVVNPVFVPARGEVVEFVVPVPENLSIDLYNSQGLKLVSIDGKNFWDGKVDGVIVPPGVYIYRLKYDGEVLMGSIVVVR